MTILTFHIGSHKTGTTSIQRALSRRMDSPSAVFLNIRKGGRKVVSTKGCEESFSARLDVDLAHERFRAALAESPWGCTHYIASDEGLFWLSEPDQVADLATRLQTMFKEVRIICYLRRQDQLALAHRKQVIAGSPAQKFYGIDVSPLPQHRPHMCKYFDYDIKLSKVWAPAFGKDNITVVPFRSDYLLNGDVVADFSARTGVRLSNDNPIRANRSLGGIQTFLGLYLTRKGIPKEAVMSIVSKAEGGGRFMPCREEARDFCSFYAISNERLARNWSCDGLPVELGEDFGMYPEAVEAGPYNLDRIRKDLSKVLNSRDLEELGMQ